MLNRKKQILLLKLYFEIFEITKKSTNSFIMFI